MRVGAGEGDAQCARRHGASAPLVRRLAGSAADLGYAKAGRDIGNGIPGGLPFQRIGDGQLVTIAQVCGGEPCREPLPLRQGQPIGTGGQIEGEAGMRHLGHMRAVERGIARQATAAGKG